MNSLPSVCMQKDFNIDLVLNKPLMAHLATTDDGEPRDSPVWFIWEDDCFWLFGTDKDSFIRRLNQNPRCAVGVVDFDLEKGFLRHVGIRGRATIMKVDHERLIRFVSKYLGSNQEQWNQWFVRNVVNPLNKMIQIVPNTVVAKDVSYFKTGPNLGENG